MLGVKDVVLVLVLSAPAGLIVVDVVVLSAPGLDVVVLVVDVLELQEEVVDVVVEVLVVFAIPPTLPARGTDGATPTLFLEAALLLHPISSVFPSPGP